jgi:hypothetical protein
VRATCTIENERKIVYEMEIYNKRGRREEEKKFTYFMDSTEFHLVADIWMRMA